MQQRYRELKALDVELIAISIDNRLDAESIVERNRLTYPVLYDTTTVVSRSWGVFDLLRDSVAAPAMFVFGESGRLVAAHVGAHAGDRPGAEDILTVARHFMSGLPPPMRADPTATAVRSSESPTAVAPTAPAATATPAADITFAESSDLALDFTLPNAHGGEVTLSDYRADKNVVLVFYRAFW